MSTDLRTEINDCEASGTTFTTSGSALATSNLPGQFYEGSNSVRAQHSNNDDELYTTTDSAGTALNINMNDVTAYVLLKDSLPQTFANRGVQILLGDGTDRIGYSVGGQDAQGIPVGPFFNVYKLDVSEIVAAPGTNFAVYAGSEANLNQGAVTEFGIGTFHNAKAQGNVANLNLDRMTYHANGSYALRINGGTVGTPETMADVQGDDVTNGWGLIANPLGELYYFFGPTEWGEPAANADVYFTAANEQWFLVGDNAGGRALGATHFPFRVVGNATDTISFVLDNVVIVNTGTRAQFDMSSADVDTLALDAVTFTDLGAITMPVQDAGNKFCFNSIFNNCDQVDLQSLDCDNLTFNGTTDANGAIIWDADDGSEENQDNLTFNSDGTGHAIYLTINTAAATTFNIDGYTFNGFAGQDGTAGNRVFLIDNQADGDITINLTNCQALNVVGTGSGFSFELSAGTASTVTIQQTVSITITVIDTAGNPIEGAKVFLEESGGTDIIPFDITNASGQVTTTYAGSTPQAVVGYVAKGTAAPVYKRTNINDTIGSTGLSATITMVSDE
ncbi:MAG: hypothetical protein AMJ84_00360 [Acidithiobacillales bacterium SM23_46]|nr:MAG: hypothetical protein AMJ84_00360 [Acidithiobacillales bacterium SM23_46]